MHTGLLSIKPRKYSRHNTNFLRDENLYLAHFHITYVYFDNCRMFAFPPIPKLHPCRHCLHTWIRILNYFLIFRCKHSQHARHRCHVNMACNPWLETWDVAIIHTGGTRIRVTVQWITVDHMALSPAELDLIWTAAVNSHVMTRESQAQSRTIAIVHPLHYFATDTDRFSQ